MSEHKLHNVAPTGRIVPAIWLSFKASQSSGAHSSADKNYLYLMQNECVYEWDIVAKADGKSYHLKRYSNAPKGAKKPSGVKRVRLYSGSLNTYINPSVTATVWNKIADAAVADKLEVFITFRIWFHKIFYETLKWYARGDSDLHNLADPDDATKIQATYTYLKSGKYKLKTGWKEIKDVPCILKDETGIVPRGAKPPLKKVYCYLKVQEASGGIAEPGKEEIARCIAAADWTKLNRYGVKNPSLKLQGLLQTWSKNVGGYCRNYTNYDRGKKIFDHIVKEGKAKADLIGVTVAPRQLLAIDAIRDEIDRKLITANAWTTPRETGPKENLQLHLSKIFGGMTKKKSWPGPIVIYRNYVEVPLGVNNDYEKSSALVCQMGLAHCGEHAWASFAIIQKIMKMDAKYESMFKHAILSGQANVDHQFVVGGFCPATYFKTIGRDSNKVYKNQSIDIFNLRAALSAAGVDGFICDPYLEQFRKKKPERKKLTAKRLLQAITSKTDHIEFSDVYPAPPPPTRGPLKPKGTVRGV